MKKISYFLTVLGMVLFLQSCYYDELPADSGVLPTNVSFSQDVQRIFNVSCIGCHSGAIKLDLRSANSYQSLINGNYVLPNDATNSKLIKSLKGDGMAIMPPTGGLSNSDINSVIQWINEGAIKN